VKACSASVLHLTLNQQVADLHDGSKGARTKRFGFEYSPSLVLGRCCAMMALSLMAEHNDVRLAEWPAHSLYFMGTK